MNQQGHTPGDGGEVVQVTQELPWLMCEGQYAGHHEIRGPAFKLTFWTMATDISPEQATQRMHDAWLIVTAVNHHQALLDALREARDALHQHYVDWGGEPEDAVPLQLALIKIDTLLSQIGEA